MNPTILKRTLRDYWLLAGGATILLFAFVILFMFATHSVPLEEGRRWLQLEWVRKLMQAMLGADLGEALTTTGLASFVFTHPLTWVLVVSFILAVSSGALSGEMDRGTIEMIATLPVSRARIYTSVSIVLFLMGLPILFGAWAGVWVGAKLNTIGDVGMMAKLAIVAVNFYAAYLLLAALSLCISASCERRGVTLIICFLLIFYSFILNLLAAFWPRAQEVAFTGFLHYYQPLPIVIHTEWPWRNMGILVGAGASLWIAGLIRFCRRDIHVT
ncbi:MAG TPA: ABC transporter permease subunit [Phycisphaerae bacterium]|nr:ABC transporter permease subunit [Phycisphaerae bacterium]